MKLLPAIREEERPGIPEREILGEDAFAPPAMAERIDKLGAGKLRLPLPTLGALGVLGGGFVAAGCLFSTIFHGPGGPAPSLDLLLGGIAFAMGYFLVAVAGAEVFTSNNLQVLALASRHATFTRLGLVWIVILAGNAIGAAGFALMVLLSGVADVGHVAEESVRVAVSQVTMEPTRAFFLGVLGNVLICLAYWIAMAGRSVADRFLGMLLPLAAVAALGLQHVVASLYFLPLGFLLAAWPHGLERTLAANLDVLAVGPAIRQLVLVTAGNVFGGTVLVGLMYHYVYHHWHRRPSG